MDATTKADSSHLSICRRPDGSHNILLFPIIDLSRFSTPYRHEPPYQSGRVLVMGRGLSSVGRGVRFAQSQIFF